MESELKYNLNKDGCINEVAFNIKNPIGELIGIKFIKKEFSDSLIQNLEKSDDEDYFDIALQMTINDGIKFFVEIDYPEELVEAKKFIKEHVQNGFDLFYCH